MATSKLSAVNTLLAIIGEAPVNSLNAPLTGDASLAERTLDEVSREVIPFLWTLLQVNPSFLATPLLFGSTRLPIHLKGLFYAVLGFLIALGTHMT